MSGNIRSYEYYCPKCDSLDFYEVKENRVRGIWFAVRNYDEVIKKCRKCDVRMSSRRNPIWVAEQAKKKSAEEAAENSFRANAPKIYFFRNLFAILAGICTFIPTPVTWGCSAVLGIAALILDRFGKKKLNKNI